MAFKITIPTYEQLSTMMSHLMTNYTNLERNFHKIFFDTTPQNVDLQLYDEAGDLKNYVIPNRAKDFTYILNGEGSPENVTSANVGSIYQDTRNGELYIKQFDTGVTGWVKIDPKKSIEKGYVSGDDGPNGYLVREKGALYEDIGTATLYIKTTDTGNDGWVAINADVSGYADVDLSNLSLTGADRFAQKSLANITTDARNWIESKQTISNLITSITSNRDDKYPSEGAVVNYVAAKENQLNLRIDSRANIDLNNLSEIGEARLSKLIPYVISSGPLDSNGQLAIVSYHSEGYHDQSWSEGGKSHEFSIPATGDYPVIMVGAGGGKGGVFATTFTNGGSGASFEGVLHLESGTYTVVIGKAGTTNGNYSYTGTDGGATSLYKDGELIFTVGGGTGGKSGTKGTGGTVDLTNSHIVSKVDNHSGNGTDGNKFSAQEGEAYPSNYYGRTIMPKYTESGKAYGRGASWGNDVPGSGGKISGKTSGDGYFKISNLPQLIKRIDYDVSTDHPLQIVDIDGLKHDITSIDSDNTESLDGKYNKFIDENGSELLKNKVYKSVFAPSGTINEGDVWIQKGEPIKVYKYSANSTWEDYRKIFLCSFEVSSGVPQPSTIHPARLYDNGFNTTQYQGVVVEFFASGNSWYRAYSDGWCEQGGAIPSSSGASGTITFSNNFRAANDYIIVTGASSGTVTISDKTVSGFTWGKTASADGYWVAMGYLGD